MDKVDLAGSWTKAWSVFSTGNEKIFTILSVVGVIIFVASLAGYIWQRRRGSGGNTGAVIGAGVVGMLFCAPQVVIPLLLVIVDLLANTVVRLLGLS